ncbi:MAG: hypothetical protein Q8J70_12130 [Thiobacillus sp.]|nr:hypothetical protein [Thiobacillus sp.]
MSSKSKIPSTDEAWENRTLGAEEAYVQVADASIENEFDEASGTQLISIRMQKTMIDELKVIAMLNNDIGYQTLIKQMLQRFIEAEKKKVWNEMVAEKLKSHRADACEKSKASKARKVA